jgi:hypothetical protein
MAEAYKDTPFDTAQSMLHVVKKHYHLVPKEEWEKFEGDERTIHLFKTKGKVYAVKEFYTRTGGYMTDEERELVEIRGLMYGMDGNQFTCHQKDFTNLQECPCGFGNSRIEAFHHLMEQLDITLKGNGDKL